MMKPRKSAGGVDLSGRRSPAWWDVPGSTRTPHLRAALTTESVAATSSSPKIDPMRA